LEVGYLWIKWLGCCSIVFIDGSLVEVWLSSGRGGSSGRLLEGLKVRALSLTEAMAWRWSEIVVIPDGQLRERERESLHTHPSLWELRAMSNSLA